MQRDDVGRGRRRGPRDHLTHRRVLALDLLTFGVAQGLDMEQQRLLDLGRVEQAAAALGRDLRMIGEHDGRADHRIVLRRRRAPETC